MSDDFTKGRKVYIQKCDYINVGCNCETCSALRKLVGTSRVIRDVGRDHILLEGSSHDWSRDELILINENPTPVNLDPVDFNVDLLDCDPVS